MKYIPTRDDSNIVLIANLKISSSILVGAWGVEEAFYGCGAFYFDPFPLSIHLPLGNRTGCSVALKPSH